MRAAFDTTCDIWYGEGATNKRQLRSFGDCRKVAELYELIQETPFDGRLAYITMDFDTPVGPVASGSFPSITHDFSKGDVLAIPAGSAPAYYVLFTEKVSYSPQPDYWRAHVHAFTPTQATGQSTCGAITNWYYHNLVGNKSGSGVSTFSWNWFSYFSTREYSIEIVSCTDAGVVARCKHGTCAAAFDDAVQVGVGQTAWFTPAAGTNHYLRVGRESGSGAWTAAVILHSRPL